MTNDEQIAKQTEQLAKIKSELFMHTLAAGKLLDEYKADPDTPPEVRAMGTVRVQDFRELVKACDLANEFILYRKKTEQAPMSCKEKETTNNFIWYDNGEGERR